MISVTVTPADQVAGLLSLTQAQAQKIIDLEIHVATLKRMLVEGEASIALNKEGAKPDAQAPASDQRGGKK